MNGDKGTLENVRQWAEELKAMMNMVPSVVLISHDPESRVITGNAMANEMFEGKEGENLSGGPTSGKGYKYSRRFFREGRELPPDELPLRRAALDGIKVSEAEMEVLLPSGRRRLLTGNAYPLFDAEGRVQGAIGSFVDITERKRAEQVLKMSEEKFAKAFHGTVAAKTLTRLSDGKFIDVNDRWLKINGITRLETIGRTAPELKVWAHPEQRYDFIRELERNGFLYERDYEFRRKNGEIWIGLLSSQIIEIGGEKTILSSLLDITEQKKAEEALKESEARYRSLFQENQAVMLLIDPSSGDIIDANQAACDYYGYERAMLTSMKITDINVLGPEEVREEMDRALRTERRHFDFRHRLSCGEIRDVEVYSGPINVQGKTLLYSIVHDTTERRRVGNALKESESKYRGLFENLQEVAAIYEYIYDDSGQIIDAKLLDANPLWLKANRTNLEEALGKHHSQLFGRKFFEETLPIFRRMKAPGEPIVMERPFPPGGPESRLSYFPLDKDRFVVTVIDISQIKRAQQVAEESATFLRGITDNAKDAIFVKDLDGLMLTANPAYFDLMGLEPEEVLGKGVTDYHLNPEVAQKIAQDEKRVVETGTGETVEERVLTKNGWRTLNTTKAPYRNGEGRIVGYIGIARDITERKRAEEALAKNLAVLSKSQEIAHLGNWSLDFDTGEFEASDEDYRIYGLEPQSKTILDQIWKLIHPDDLARYREYVEAVQRNGWLGGIDYRLVMPDGSIRYVHAITDSVIRGQDGKVRTASGTTQDITERKRAEEALAQQASLIDLSPDAIIVRKMDGTITFWSQGAAKLYGWGKEEAIGRTAHKLLRTHFPEPLNEMNSKLEQDGRWFGELVHYTKENEVVTVQSRWLAKYDTKGTVTNIFESNVDITNRKKAEDELRRSNAELQQFAYVASHDLKEPLRMVTSYLQLLEKKNKDKLDDKSKECLHFAEDGARRMQAMINDILAYSRVETKGNPFDPVDMNDVFATVCKDLRSSVEESGASVTHDNLPTVMADKLQMVLLLENLVGNAIKYRDVAAPQIHVSARGGKNWVFAVEDNGIGIDPKHKDRLFQMFQRLHTREEYPGTGMGLAIAKKIVDRHGGRIWFESQEGEGTTFYFTIPMRS